MSPTLNGISALQCFEHSNAIEMRNGIFDFYLGLPPLYLYVTQRRMNECTAVIPRSVPHLLNLIISDESKRFIGLLD